MIDNLEGDGIIARIENRRIADAVMKLGLPVVDVSAARTVPELPFVETDDVIIAGLAADHLLERGFNHYAFCGDERYKWSIWREEEFVRIVTGKGHGCPVYRHHPEGGKRPQIWLRRNGNLAIG